MGVSERMQSGDDRVSASGAPALPPLPDSQWSGGSDGADQTVVVATRKHGDNRRFLERLASAPPADCVTWPFGRSSGYGMLRDYRHVGPGRKPWIKAHRLAWELHHGRPFPAGLVARHTCDNGAQGCVNPLHIIPGTVADNRRDCIERGRNVSSPGERNGSCRLTSQQIDDMRVVAPGRTQRELAAMFGVSQPHVSRVLNRKQRIAA